MSLQEAEQGVSAADGGVSPHYAYAPAIARRGSKV
jgi:hypothetical protein